MSDQTSDTETGEAGTPDMATADDVRAIVDHIMTMIDQLLETIARETERVRAGQLAAAADLAPRKSELNRGSAPNPSSGSFTAVQDEGDTHAPRKFVASLRIPGTAATHCGRRSRTRCSWRSAPGPASACAECNPGRNPGPAPPG